MQASVVCSLYRDETGTTKNAAAIDDESCWIVAQCQMGGNMAEGEKRGGLEPSKERQNVRAALPWPAARPNEVLGHRETWIVSLQVFPVTRVPTRVRAVHPDRNHMEWPPPNPSLPPTPPCLSPSPW